MKRDKEYRFKQKIRHGELDNVFIINEEGEEIQYSSSESKKNNDNDYIKKKKNK